MGCKRIYTKLLLVKLSMVVPAVSETDNVFMSCHWI